MTCIVGMLAPDGILMGGDSAAIEGMSSYAVVHPKVFRNGELLVGYTTSFRMGQLLEHSLVVPDILSSEDSLAAMVKKVVPAVREVLKGGGVHDSPEQPGRRR